jgi:hypothetical protein
MLLKYKNKQGVRERFEGVWFRGVIAFFSKI